MEYQVVDSKKQEMLLALFESDIQNKLKTALHSFKDSLLSMKTIPAPISDIVDAIWLSKK